MGAQPYLESIVKNSPIGRGLRKMCEKDKASLRVKFNSVCSKKERPFSDYPDLLVLQTKNQIQGIGKSYLTARAAANFTDVFRNRIKSEMKEELKNLRFFSILSDRSTDSANIEEELVYFLYLSDVPKVKFFSIEDAQNADANGLKECLVSAFARFDSNDFQKHLLGLNVDGAAVNMGIHGGLGALLKELSPWLMVVHCFNHRLELAIKYAFKHTAFNNIDEMLAVLYKLYKTSAKRQCELQRFGEAWQRPVPHPTKATGIRWIDHKIRAMQIVLEHFGPTCPCRITFSN